MKGTIVVDQKRYDALKATHVTMSIEISGLKAEVRRLREKSEAEKMRLRELIQEVIEHDETTG